MGTRISSSGFGIVLAFAAALFAPSAAQAQQQKVLRAVLHADVRTLDPFWTTQTIAGIHGMLVYDTLFGNDDKLNPQPQMVGKYEVSADKLTYTFTLRDGLKFHDGSPVTTKDVIASLKRWAARDNAGQRLFSFVEKHGGGRRQDLPHGAQRSPTAWCSSRSARAARRSPSSCASRKR